MKHLTYIDLFKHPQYHGNETYHDLLDCIRSKIEICVEQAQKAETKYSVDLAVWMFKGASDMLRWYGMNNSLPFIDYKEENRIISYVYQIFNRKQVQL